MFQDNHVSFGNFKVRINKIFDGFESDKKGNGWG